jgi:alanyl-tRNA synthetase
MKEAVSAGGGRGGGTKDMAQGGVPSPELLQTVLESVRSKPLVR